MRRMMVPLAAAALTAGPVAADVENGRDIAQEHCARCHDIERGGAMKTYPPSFASIAVFRAEEQIRARIMFPALHSPMPQWVMYLQSAELDDVTAYILSLEGE